MCYSASSHIAPLRHPNPSALPTWLRKKDNMSAIFKILSVVAFVLSCGCNPDTRKEQEDSFGCSYVTGYEPEYLECNLAGHFERDCLYVGGEMVGKACRVVRGGRPEYTAPSEYTRRYDFSHGSWTDCKPHAVPAREPGDPHECYGVEEGDDPAKTPVACLSEPPVWCPTNP